MISVILPVYNIKDEYLICCCESLLKQNVSDVEYIFVDDKSTYDNTIKIIEQYINKDERFKLIKQDVNRGVSVARNVGLLNASGEYVMFIDSDDWVRENYLNDVEKAIAQHMEDSTDVLILGSQFLLKKENAMVQLEHINEYELSGKEIEKLQLQIYRRDAYYKNINPCSMLARVYRKNLLVDNNVFSVEGVKKEQDCIFSLYLYDVAKRIKIINFTGYFYRINEESVCHRYNPKIEDIYATTLNEYKKFAQKKNAEFMAAYNEKASCVWDTIVVLKYWHKDNNHSLQNKINELKHNLDKEIYKEALRDVKLANFNVKRKIIIILLKYRFLRLYLLVFKAKLKGAK